MLLARHGASSVMAGGTDLLVEIKEHLRAVPCVINIKRIPDLNRMSYDGKTGLTFGALTTAREIECNGDVGRHYPGLQQAVRDLGSIQVRNRATVIGNICRASPSADTPPPLIAGGAFITLGNGTATREMLLEDFFLGPGKTALQPGELALAIRVPPPPVRCGRIYIKHGRRKAMELATVGVAVSIALDASGRCTEARIALGAVAPVPIRAPEAERALVGSKLDATALQLAATLAMQASKPISNVRASAGYRREMVGVLTRRALEQALAQIQ